MTVVHRLRGWKLLAWLAASGPPALELDDLPSTADAHTNIVAGYVFGDGRIVAVRLSQAEAELEMSRMTPPALFQRNAFEKDEGDEFTLVTADDRHIAAKFVGLDSATGLSFLEAAEPLITPVIFVQGDTDDPTVGQRVRLYAPTPAAKPAARSGVGYIYLSIDQKEGLLTDVKRGPSGGLVRVVARATITPEWTGAVAANELGDVVGIVSDSVSSETQIVPIAIMLIARDRVLKLRGSAPQPWLGVRGDASFQLKLSEWVSMGWKPEIALPRIREGQGVFLTSVAPGTPAALAGFRPGDVIASIGPRAVHSVEDLSTTLSEAGVGSTIDFTVWRALEPSPVRLSVQLKGAQNPALATAEAEQRAARESLLTLQRQVVIAREKQKRLGNSTSAIDREATARLTANLREAEERLENVMLQVNEANARVEAARGFASLASESDPGQPRAATAPMQNFGLRAIGLTTRIASRLGATGGLLVVTVRAESPAEASGLRAGDVIETINSDPFTLRKLTRLLSSPRVQSIALVVIREGRRLTLTLTPSLDDDIR